MDALLADLRYAFRSLRASKALVIVAALSVGVGIGLVTSVFSVVYRIVLEPPAVTSAGELVNFYTQEKGSTNRGPSSYADLSDLRREMATLDGLVGYSWAIANVETQGRPTPKIGAIVSERYFDVLGVAPFRGRTFSPSEEVKGASPTVLATYDYWQRELGGEDISGKTLRVAGQTVDVIGVLPRGFAGLMGGIEPQLFFPMATLDLIEPMGEIDAAGSRGEQDLYEWRGYRFMTLTGRLAEGATLAEAESEAQAKMGAFAASFPDTNEDLSVVAVATSAVRINPDADTVVTPFALIAVGIVAVFLVIACANVANLLLARATGRRKEMAVRLSLGASRAQIVRQLVVEGLVLGTLAAAVGLTIAFVGQRMLGSLDLGLPIDLRLGTSMNGAVIGLALLSSLVSGLVFGLVPALQSSNPAILPALRDATSSVGSGSRRRFLNPSFALVVAQVSLSLMLVVLASLLTRSVVTARGVDVGFDVDRIAIATLDLTSIGAAEDDAGIRWRELADRLGSVPGIESVSWASRIPLGLNQVMSTFFIEDFRDNPERPGVALDISRVDASYFDAMGVGLAAGRAFRELEANGRVLVVNEAFVDRFFADRNPLGQLIRVHSESSEPYEIVGVVRDYKVRTPGEAPRPMVHFFSNPERRSAYGNLVLRGSGDPRGLLPGLRSELSAFHPDLFVMDLTTLQALREMILLPQKLGSNVTRGVGALALGLAAVGLAGLVGYWVSRRTQEIGLRMALGATKYQIARLVLARSLLVVAIGVVVGVAAAWALARVMGSILYVPATDPSSIAVSVLVLVAAAVVASWGPASRAANIDPTTALGDSR